MGNRGCAVCRYIGDGDTFLMGSLNIDNVIACCEDTDVAQVRELLYNCG